VNFQPYPYYSQGPYLNYMQSNPVNPNQVYPTNPNMMANGIVIGSPVNAFDNSTNPMVPQQTTNLQYPSFQQNSDPRLNQVGQNPQTVMNIQPAPFNYNPQQIQYYPVPVSQQIEMQSQNMQAPNGMVVASGMIAQQPFQVPIQNDMIRAEMFGQVYLPTQQIIKIASRHPQVTFCPRCSKNVVTRVEYKVGTGTFVSGAFIAFVGGTLGCCLIPCCLDDCKDAVHLCSECTQELGTKKFLVK